MRKFLRKFQINVEKIFGQRLKNFYSISKIMLKFWENLKILQEYYEKTGKTQKVYGKVLKNDEIITRKFQKNFAEM